MPRQTASATAATPATHWLALDHQLCFALYAASLAMTKAYKPLLAPLGLTYPQYLALLVLWEGDGITVSQLGERLTLDSGTLTPLLKRLESLGLVQRQRDVADERRVLLRLTPAGQALRAQAVAVPQAIACATACDLQQIGSLATQLHQLRRQLTASMAEPVSPPAASDPAAAVPPRP
ncbi:MarR family winged helix-turn-helix transcriptional regulator [Pseudaquabacterium pictum]|uniref:MarR family transcriptional regulator n=1 Tax=Pseudaquabacterium pictum TaxID=2315236 RepID=A0A480AQE6_9BURK|nr:MarR family transcriptional regulator [Rubrivivax pictus]GCL61905.1 MarR family transcriptional regulator [Rubrivivax pictus]